MAKSSNTITTTSTKLNLVHQFNNNNKSSPPSSSSRATSLTPSPSSWRHFFYVLTIYRYVLLCLLFGCMSLIIGVALFLLALLFRFNTTSVNLIESVPLYMPGLILFCNGLSLVAFMNKNTRRLYLLKSVCGLYFLVALLMIIVAVTTSTTHLPRLHSHRECAYNVRIRACTCVVSSNQQNQNSPSSNLIIASSKHFIMEEIMNCDLVHGIIFDSLRIVFALSLLAITVSIFSIMTLYQLSTYEKQKTYFKKIAIVRHNHQQQIGSHHKTEDNHIQPSLSLSSSVNRRSISSEDFPPTIVTNTITATTAGGSQQQPMESDQLSAQTIITNFKCLSADFSSQDLLLDHQTSTIYRKNKFSSSTSPPEDCKLFSPRRILKPGDKIWSSSQSTTTHPIEPHSSNHESGEGHQISNLRRYMSAIFDTSTNLQSYVLKKLNSIKEIKANSRGELFHHQKQKYENRHRNHQLLPPHVTIPRFSMSQLSSIIDISNQNSNKTVKHIFQSSSSSYDNSSSSSSSCSSGLSSRNQIININQSIRYHLTNNAINNNLASEILPESQLIFQNNDSSNNNLEARNVSDNCFELDECLFNNVEQACTDFTSKYCQQQQQKESTNKNDMIDVQIQQQQPKDQIYPEWPKCLNDLATSFECIDEDDELIDGCYPPHYVFSNEHVVFEQTHQPLTLNELPEQQIEDNMNLVQVPEPQQEQRFISYFNSFETSILHQTINQEQSTITTIDNPHQSSDIDNNHQYLIDMDQQQNQPSLVEVFTFVSSNQTSNSNTDCHHQRQICTTFEEAFKNYYDSQNRISNNSYYTLPLKTCGEGPKDPHHHHHNHNHHYRHKGQSNRAIFRQQHYRKDHSSSQPVNNNHESLSNNNRLNNNNNNDQAMVNSINKLESTTAMNINQNNLAYPEDIPFPVAIIEPPKDYQNAVLNSVDDEIRLMINDKDQHRTNPTTKTNDLQAQSIDTELATNRLLRQSYQYWLEQLNQQQQNRLDQPTVTVDDNETANENGFIDVDDDEDCCEGEDEIEDGAGDTSTSQDIADFELELDEEPIKFVSEEDFNEQQSNGIQTTSINMKNSKLAEEMFENDNNNSEHNQNKDQNNNNTIITKLPNQTTVMVESTPLPTITAKENNQKQIEEKLSIDLLEINMNLLKRKVQEQIMIRSSNVTMMIPTKVINNNDYGFDGFRKGCFDNGGEGSESGSTTTGTSSSLSNGTSDDNGEEEQSTEEEHSITAEYVKPPTPFTNYLFES